MEGVATEDSSQVLLLPTNISFPALPRAAEILFANSTEEKKLYWDRSHYDSPESQMKALTRSSTLYIGNLAFSTRAMHIRNHFRTIGPVRSVHMGLDRFRKTPCGFCFVEYARRDDALEAVASLSGTKLDGRVIRVELDAGFQPGRQYGRGASGGQVRDDRRRSSDPARSAKGRNNNATSNPGDGTEENKGNAADGSYYGGAGDKREREPETGDADMGADRPEKNPRFREE